MTIIGIKKGPEKFQKKHIFDISSETQFTTRNWGLISKQNWHLWSSLSHLEQDWRIYTAWPALYRVVTNNCYMKNNTENFTLVCFVLIRDWSAINSYKNTLENYFSFKTSSDTTQSLDSFNFIQSVFCHFSSPTRNSLSFRNNIMLSS